MCAERQCYPHEQYEEHVCWAWKVAEERIVRNVSSSCLIKEQCERAYDRRAYTTVKWSVSDTHHKYKYESFLRNRVISATANGETCNELTDYDLREGEWLDDNWANWIRLTATTGCMSNDTRSTLHLCGDLTFRCEGSPPPTKLSETTHSDCYFSYMIRVCTLEAPSPQSLPPSHKKDIRPPQAFLPKTVQMVWIWLLVAGIHCHTPIRLGF